MIYHKESTNDFIGHIASYDIDKGYGIVSIDCYSKNEALNTEVRTKEILVTSVDLTKSGINIFARAKLKKLRLKFNVTKSSGNQLKAINIRQIPLDTRQD